MRCYSVTAKKSSGPICAGGDVVKFLLWVSRVPFGVWVGSGSGIELLGPRGARVRLWFDKWVSAKAVPRSG